MNFEEMALNRQSTRKFDTSRDVEKEKLIKRIRPEFNKYYTIKYENYGVPDHYIKPDNQINVE